MEQQLRNLFIDKPFSAEGLNIQGFSIIDIGKGKVKKGKIFSNTDFVVDSDRLLKVLENKGKVYGYTKKGQLKALYVVTRDGHSLTCDEVYFSSDLNGEPVKDLMDQQVVFLMAQNASYYKDGKAVFQGTVVPKLTTKTGPYNWYMAISFALLYSFVFCTTLHSYLGILSGIMMGLAMGSCFRSHKYEYEKPAEEK